MHNGFWGELKKPIISLSPMDGVTDAAFRRVTAEHGNPAVSITEFVSVEGIAAGAVVLMRDFFYCEDERSVVAQIFGATPDAFIKSAAVICAMGFDGIDINMGCPASSVAAHGGGAALIRTPKLAQEIIQKTKQAVTQWANGKTMKEFDVPDSIQNAVLLFLRKKKLAIKRREMPVSVKTRIGYDSDVVESWVTHLLEVEPAVISIHGRTLKQMYKGFADWDAIGRAAKIIKKTNTLVLGNGDIKDINDAKEKIAQYGVDGVLIGRAAFGNPWVFLPHDPTTKAKLTVALEHAHLFEKIYDNKKPFVAMRKHLTWYAHGFDGAKELRVQLMKANNANDCDIIVGNFIKLHI